MADTVLNITIPEEHNLMVLEALTELAAKDLKISSKDLKSVSVFSFDSKQPNESNRVFAERAVRALVKSFIKLRVMGEDRANYRNAVENITVQKTEVHDGILT